KVMSYASLTCPPRQLLISGGDFCEMVHLSRRGRHLPIPCRGAERNFSGKRVRITGYKCRRRCARSPAHTTADPLGDSLAVEPRTLTPVALVRIQVPQPLSFYILSPVARTGRTYGPYCGMILRAAGTWPRSSKTPKGEIHGKEAVGESRQNRFGEVRFDEAQGQPCLDEAAPAVERAGRCRRLGPDTAPG